MDIEGVYGTRKQPIEKEVRKAAKDAAKGFSGTSGTVYRMSTLAGAYNITLPTAVVGQTFTFVFTAITTTNDLTFNCAALTDAMVGCVTISPDDGAENTWEVPGKPDRPKVVPFPVPWLPHRLELTEADDDADHARGFVFLPGVCVDSGKDCAVGVVVSCCRCGVSLHPAAAHMIAGFDPPYCSRCRWVIKLVL